MRRKGRQIIYKTPEEIELIRASCLLVCKTLAHVGAMLRPGMTGAEADEAAETFIRDHGAVPGFKGLYGCPSTLLISRNEAVVHGLPFAEQVFEDGDILSIDCGVLMNDFYGDAAYTFCLGEVEEATLQLCRVTNESLYRGIEQATVGNRVGDISHAIQHYTEREHGYSVVRELVGHGLGRAMHEAPDVPNYGRRGKGAVLKEGLVIAIEPMINMGRKEVRTLSDDWTIVTKDRKPSAHYEHTIVVTQDGPDILSNHEIVVEAIQQNPNVQPIVRETVA
ncbi:MAG: type I methionyl aminopeptidase [Lewinella sp.]|nr:type I methionyl aminopeptidase [Lewinella sp.]